MLSPLRLAISFLTIIPLYNKKAENQELTRSVSYYPVVGFLLGSIAAGVSYGLRTLGLTLAADVLAVVTMIILTGGLHLDGLMDTADGLFSGRSVERKLEIMKDSRVGAMGVIAFITVLLLKVSFLFELSLAPKLTALILAPTAGRWAMVYAITRYPYARPTGGLGACLKQAGRWQLAAASIFFLAVSLALMGPGGLGLVGLAVLGTVVTAWYISKCIGGMTGDTYGATGELIETWTLLAILLGQQLGII
ncbi:Cobalamin synthase [Desulfotomaculum nigrificans CO-1-SRB]|uniref:Adenosylcobinamide-GDP ribazoletransferase n=1 Tax=Desulfotomaculum nigrificans (strain DSM 14880 / VKM B-2319 / CO-1-SRB) TaxID=868595 RepID=F6B835_DESCC|nr:adenosylcobinamide-GDP ribazoletransferase [Desulfotomaculum nigrificans]AEF93480.1 Cobalamin synthase [Desulfotomaculum nigrificans CO-1-SRB]